MFNVPNYLTFTPQAGGGLPAWNPAHMNAVRMANLVNAAPKYAPFQWDIMVGQNIPGSTGANLGGFSTSNPIVNSALNAKAAELPTWGQGLAPGTEVSLNPFSHLPPPPTAATPVAEEAAGGMAKYLPTVAKFQEGGLGAFKPQFLTNFANAEGLIPKAGALWGAVPSLSSIAKGVGSGIAADVTGKLIGQNLFGDNQSNNSDPTNAGQAFGRGVSGGGKIGAFLGPTGALVGALGAGIGNAAGFALNDAVNGDAPGDSHLGNVPLIGGMFGGGSAKAQDDLTDHLKAAYGFTPDQLTAEAFSKRLDDMKLDPNVRKQITDAFNQRAADLRTQGSSLEDATGQAAKEFFTNQTDENGKVTQQGKAFQIRDATNQQANAPGGSNDPYVQEAARQQLAMQGLINQIAPQLLAYQANRQDYFNNMLNDAIGNLPQSQQANARMVQALDNNASGRSLDTLLSIPAMVSQQYLDTQRQRAIQEQAQFRQAQLAALAAASAGGASGSPDLSNPK